MQYKNQDITSNSRETYNRPELFIPERPAWQKHGSCVDLPSEMFFPERGGDGREAKAVCKECSVKEECLEFALGHAIIFGIWGGTSERQRIKIKRERRRQPPHITQ